MTLRIGIGQIRSYWPDYYAALAESVDALDLGSSEALLIRNGPVRIRIPCVAFRFQYVSKGLN